ncbi:hypothetical protein GCM10027169_31140 [Gordonia jinhuaensis]|uniref:Uncharacterized protein n=2 Tax=Gordonia jinhuaensis TaxID=1517702 RepID=A0A916T9F7_9ACTN|nr:hypothetical protein GCM10011489_23690 [Gordonia jinhuaensis]
MNVELGLSGPVTHETVLVLAPLNLGSGPWVPMGRMVDPLLEPADPLDPVEPTPMAERRLDPVPPLPHGDACAVPVAAMRPAAAIEITVAAVDADLNRRIWDNSVVSTEISLA